MTSRSLACFIVALGVALMLASAAQAAKKAKRPIPDTNTATAERCRGGNQFPCGAVYFGEYYLGTDPDPFIRSQIQRDLGAKFGDPN